jgi:flagellum-specific peptidoglycan hydrolase FlgJ
VAIGEQTKFGIPASIKLAQGLLESAAGTGKLAVKQNNHFGIKCFRTDCPKGHCTNHTDDSHKDFFRVYDSAWESWREHSKRITEGRYAAIGGKCARDYTCWAQGLKDAGYATDAGYADKLIRLIDDLKLWRFDQGHTITWSK